MKHTMNTRRPRNRGNGKRSPGSRTQTFESNGPEGKIRGTAQQVLDRYLAMGRDASSAGDIIAAESFFQYAEHYYRVMHGDGFGGSRPRPPAGDEMSADGESSDDVSSEVESVGY